jgi:hypothetical protein
MCEQWRNDKKNPNLAAKNAYLFDRFTSVRKTANAFRSAFPAKEIRRGLEITA